MQDHIFYNHNLKPIHQFAVFNNSPSLIWPSVVLILGLALFVFLRITSFQKVIDTFRSSFSIQAIKQLEREEFNPFNPTSFALSSLFVLMVSFFIYKINQVFGYILPNKSSLIQYLFFVLMVCLFLPLKFVIKKLIGFICKTEHLINEIFYNNLVINHTLGLLLLPLMAIVELSQFNANYLLITAFVISIVAMTLKLYRGLMFSLFENHIGILQVFIYLCALEILPFLVFIKLIITHF